MDKKDLIVAISVVIILIFLIVGVFVIGRIFSNRQTIETYARLNYSENLNENKSININSNSNINVEKMIIDKENQTVTSLEENENVTRQINDTNTINSNNEIVNLPENTINNRVEVLSEYKNKEKQTRKIDPSKPMVALTFDDGPNNTATPKILDTLEKYGAVATFFDLGTCIKAYPKVVKREEALGCEVESHTYSHQNLNTLSANKIKKDMSKAIKVYTDVLGHKPTLVRPPYGNANSTVRSTIQYPLINWDIDTLDWKSRNAESILKEIHKYSDYDGRIILMHGIYTSTAEAVEILVPELIEKGYQLVTVSEMAKYKNVTLKPGKVYLNFR